MTLTQIIIQKLELPTIIKNRHGNSPEITSISFIDSILLNVSTVQVAADLKLGEQTVNRIIKKYFVPKLGNTTGGNNNWKYKLLKAIEYKQCFSCNIIKPYSKFGTDNATNDSKFRMCKYCRSTVNSTMYGARKLRIPSWYSSEKEKIAEFYDNCPQGYHVDHIIPLQGKYVSGLHTLSNLQYLLAEENIRKGNKYCPGGEIGETQET